MTEINEWSLKTNGASTRMVPHRASKNGEQIT